MYILLEEHDFAERAVLLALRMFLGPLAERATPVLWGNIWMLRVPLLLLPAYVVAFIGSAGSYPFRAGGLALGLGLCVFFAYLARRGYFRRNPRIGYSVLYLLACAAGAGGVRSRSGLMQSMSSRCTIYSILLVIFAWVAIVEEFLVDGNGSGRRNRFFLGAAGMAILFSAVMDIRGVRFENRRNLDLVHGIAMYEHPAFPGSTEGPMTPSPAGQVPSNAAYNLHVRDILRQSAELGTYRLPSY